MISYYILVVSRGMKIQRLGPYPTFLERDEAALIFWNSSKFNPWYEKLFWLDVVNEEIRVGAFPDLEFLGEDA